MANYQEIADLINRNLLGNPAIEPEKHREVEFALLNAIIELSKSSIKILNQGRIKIGDVNGTDMRWIHTFPDVGTNEYYVLGSIQCVSNNWNNDNDVFWCWGEPTRTSFALYFREVSAQRQNIDFWYMIIPKTF